MEEYALLVATLTQDGHLLSNIHFKVDCIGSETDMWDEFFDRAEELRNVDIFESVSAPFARGVDPTTGFVKVYRIQRIS